jgi:peptide/nickel transport system substrate-binding protein
MHRSRALLLTQSFALGCLLALTACRRPADPHTLRFIIESSPNNLDLRQGTDAQSERLGGLIYDALAQKDDHFNLQPMLATSWERPDALTWVFHLRPDVRFHDGHVLNSADVAWSINSMRDGTLITAKGSSLASIHDIATPNALTVVVHLTHPDNALLFNLSDGLFGVVEQGAGRDEGDHPNGTGPFRFVSQAVDKDVVLAANTMYWAGPPHIARIRFVIVPDTITAALEMKKGSADIESNVLTMDMVHALADVPSLRTEDSPGATVLYLNFNVTEGAVRDVRVRQAIAYAIDRPPLIAALWRGHAQAASTLLPATHWAAASAADLPRYPHDPQRAEALLEAAGYKPDAHGIRLHVTLKISTDETTRLVAQAMQDQLLAAGIQMDIRSAEFGTFYADITHGAFQMYMLRWIGVNEDPDIFRYVFASASFPPKGANRGHYDNPALDALLMQAANASDQPTRRALYLQAQQILATDLPTLPLWYVDNVVVHNARVTGIVQDPGGYFGFLRTARFVEPQPQP